MDVGSNSSCVKWYQKEIWQLSKLPYYDDLERYIDYHGRRLSKDDHILFVRLLNCLVTKGNTFKDVKIAMHCLNKLLGKRDFLLRGDLVIDWRPLLELKASNCLLLFLGVHFVLVTFHSEDGIFLMPDGFKAELHAYISHARRYFSDDSPQQLLDELRPLMCVWDESVVRAWRLLELFMPMNIAAERQLTHGSGLWLDEAWHWFVTVENNSLVEASILKMFVRLSVECPGSVNWYDKLDVVFTKLIRSFRLGNVVGLCQQFNLEAASGFITFAMGTQCHEKLMHNLGSVFRLVESYLHPSNHGIHTQNLLVFMNKYVIFTLIFLKRERMEKTSSKPRTFVKIPASMRLSQNHLDQFVTQMLPCLKLAMFSKARNEFVTPIVKCCCSISPKVVLPAVLDVVYPALETLTEPHRLLQALQVLVAVAPMLAKDQPDKDGKSFRVHAINLMSSLLPGLDQNDMGKCLTTFQIVGVLVNLIPLVDCSDAVHLRSDLTDEEKELCSATANFDSIIAMFMDKWVSILFHNKKDFTFRGTISVFKGICRNSSTALYKVAVDRLYNFLCEHVFDSKTVSTAISDMVFVAVKVKISIETYSEEKVDFQVIWWLSMADRVLKAPANHILENWSAVRELLELVLPLKKCTLATVVKVLGTSITINSLIIMILRYLQNSGPMHWSATVDKKTWSPQWHVPSIEDIDCAAELFRDFVIPPLQALAAPHGMDKREVMHHIILIRNAVLGASASLPFFEGPNYGLEDSPSLESVEHPIALLTLDGKSLRDVVLKSMRTLLEYLFEQSEDDVKSIQQIAMLGLIKIYIIKDLYVTSVLSYRTTKAILSDQLVGNRGYIEMLSEEYVLLMHKKRNVTQSGYQCKPQHIEILRMLVKIGTSTYSQNRIKAQLVLVNLLKDYPFAHKSIIGELIDLLNPSRNSSHEQIKGTLHILTDHKRDALLLRAGFEAQLLAMPAIVGTSHSEKPSIIGLLEQAQNSIVDYYESYRIEYEVIHFKVIRANADNLGLAEKLLSLATDPNLHWRHVDMAQAFLSLLVRRDVPYPEPVLRMWVRLLVHDTVKARRMATAVVASWLKLNKPKAVKREWIILNKEPNTSVGARWPIRYGIRNDNRCMMYEEERLPKTEEEWNTFQFCGKQHWGFYTWPEKLVTYAPLIEQNAIDRHDEDLSETEMFIVETFRDQEFSARLRKLFAVEEAKDESFNAVNFSLFQGLFRCFNDILCPVFKEHLEVLVNSPKGSDQKLASEMVAGLINGSKLWKWGRQRRMWTWLSPLLTKALESMKEEAMRNWGVCVATVCGCSESRMLKPLLDILFALINRPTESAFAAQSRIFLLQGGLCQFEWRTIELWNKVVAHLSKVAIAQQYANLRDRMAISLVTASWFDLPSIYYSPDIPPSLHGPTVAHCIGLYDQHKLYFVIIQKAFQNGSGDSEVKRTARLALKGALSFTLHLAGQSLTSIPPSILRLLPIFCHYSNDVGDEELYKQCLSLLSKLLQAAYVPEANLLCLMQVFRQMLKSSSCWWKSKVTMLWLMKVLVFSNLYVFATVKEEIGKPVSFNYFYQLEVRQTAANTVSGLIQSSFFPVTPDLLVTFSDRTKSMDLLERHGGVLGLSAVVLAAPYTVPSYLPDVLMRLCRFASDKQPIRDTVKKTLSEFKRTHQDSWREHESQFNEDQLCALRNLFVSPNYYV
uniref:Proteasome activator complex subunit 4 n=1 Tax=Angiostrongylus cantonensis TaxID=6313 RepID=A0A158P870_ANGCA